jgi:hypothetical protein
MIGARVEKVFAAQDITTCGMVMVLGRGVPCAGGGVGEGVLWSLAAWCARGWHGVAWVRCAPCRGQIALQFGASCVAVAWVDQKLCRWQAGRGSVRAWFMATFPHVNGMGCA